MITGLLVFLGLSTLSAGNVGAISNENFIMILLFFFLITFLLAFSHWLLWIMLDGDSRSSADLERTPN